MKRIAFLVCGMLLLVANTAEARRSRWSNNMTYTQSAPVAHTAYRVTPAATPQAAVTATAEANSDETASDDASPASATQASYTSTAASVPVTTAVLSTSTAQGVANIMASYNRV